MFFPNRIKNIKSTDKVLEIGPGATPYFRSDVLLEKKFDTEQNYISQFGSDQKLKTDKPVIFYEGDKFPFADKEFDYVICSHVLEHVEDVAVFLSEVFRVAGKGYFEYPLIYYEYLYNFDVHLNYLKYDNDCLSYMKKSNSNLTEFKPVQDFFYQSLQKGHDKIISELVFLFMEGFEWEKSFKVMKVTEIKEVCYSDVFIPPVGEGKEYSPIIFSLFKQLIRKIISKVS